MITLNWYVVYTKSRCEQKVANLLSKKHYRNYCPLQKVENYWSEWKRTGFEPLFPSYVFVQITESEQKQILSTPGVLSFIHWHDAPAVIPDEEISAIANFLKDHEQVRLIRNRPTDDQHLVPYNYFAQQPTLQSLQNAIKVELPTLGYYVYAPFKTETVSMPGLDSGSIAF